MKKEATNTWSEGLVMDLNPVSTPNTVLTDCVNGTIITYDGNEHSLQNDKGNYPLANCKLEKNFIPVGIKEYGDILYIVSYNPLTTETEIGSYPAPKTITSSDLDERISLDAIQTSIDSATGNTLNYSYIVENLQDMKVFYGKDPNKLKINPGDKYKLSNWITSLSGASKYETLKFYVLDENRKSYDVTDKIKNANHTSDTFAYVEWDVPGWLALQPVFARVESMDLNVKQFVVPTYAGSPIFKVSVQYTVNDPLILNSTTNDLKAKITITVGETSNTLNASVPNKLDLKNGNCLYFSDVIDLSSYLVKDKNVEIKIEPYLTYKIGETTSIVYYDNLNKSYKYSLNAKGNIEDIKIGNSSWWYNLGDSTLDIMFDTQGISKNAALTSEIYMYYSISKLSAPNDYATNASKVAYKHIKCEEWNLVGETNLSVPYVPYTSDNVTSNPKALFPEDFYIIKFDIIGNSTWSDSAEVLATFTKFIVASKVMEGFTDSRYDEISFDRWMGNYPTLIQNKQLKLNGIPQSEVDYGEVQVTPGYTAWMSNSNIKSPKGNNGVYNTFMTDGVDGNVEKIENGFDLYCNASCKMDVTASSEVKLLTGPMWENLVSGAKMEVDINDTSKTTTFSKYSGTLTSSITFGDLSVTGNKTIHYDLEPVIKSASIWSYVEESLTYSTYSLDVSGWCDASKNAKGGEIHLYFSEIPGYTSGVWKGFGFEGSSKTSNILTPSILQALTSALKTDDVFLLALSVSTFNKGGNTNYAFIGVETPSQSSDPDNKAYVWKNAGTDTQCIYFVGVKHGNDIGLINIRKTGAVVKDETVAKNIFTTWINSVKHVTSDYASETVGGFYTIKGSSTKVSDGASLYGNGKINFTTFTYNNKNLLSPSDRNALYNTPNLKVGANSTSDYTSLDSVDFNTKDAVVKFTLDFSGKDSAFAALQKTIDNTPTTTGEKEGRKQLVATEVAKYQSDVYGAGIITPQSDFYYKGDYDVNDTLITRLNAGTLSNTEEVYARGQLTDEGVVGILRQRIGFTEKDFYLNG